MTLLLFLQLVHSVHTLEEPRGSKGPLLPQLFHNSRTELLPPAHLGEAQGVEGAAGVAQLGVGHREVGVEGVLR